MWSKFVGVSINVATLVAISGTTVLSQTLPERVRTFVANGSAPPYRTHITRMLLDMDLDRIMGQADLIVAGTLTLKRTYLNAKQTKVLTDYEIVPSRVISNRRPAERPSFGQGLTLTVEGGTMIIEGVQVIVEDTDLELPEGKPLVLLLQRNDDGTLMIVGDVQGAFEVSKGQVKHLMKHSQRAEEYSKMTPEELVGRLAAVR
jgi:hypothetical protein